MTNTRCSAAVFVLLSLVLLALSAACGTGDSAESRAGVTIEPLATQTPLIGGKPAAPGATATLPPPPPDTPTAIATATDVPQAPIEPPADTATPEPPPPPTLPPAPTATPRPAGPPNAGRWIDVDVTLFVVKLMDGTTVLQEIAPVAVGVAIDNGAYASTQTGLFAVHNKIEGLAYDPPYNTYISHWVGFDTARDNGFHSFLKSQDGAVVDASTGRVSNGCIRTGGAEAIFAFAEIGMPVWVHH